MTAVPETSVTGVATEMASFGSKGITVGGQHEPDGADRHQALIGYRSGDMWAPHLEITEALALELSEFVQCVETASTPLADGRAGLRVVRLLEAATRSLAQRGRVIELQPSRQVA